MSSNRDRNNIDDPMDRKQGQNPEQRKRTEDEEEEYHTGKTSRSDEKARDEAARAGQSKGGTNK